MDLAGAVLAVAVNLDGDVVAVHGGIAVAGLHGPADAEIKRKADHGDFAGDLADGVVGGAIVDDQDVEIRQRPVSRAPVCHGPALVEGRDDDQAFEPLKTDRGGKKRRAGGQVQPRPAILLGSIECCFDSSPPIVISPFEAH